MSGARAAFKAVASRIKELSRLAQLAERVDDFAKEQQQRQQLGIIHIVDLCVPTHS